MNYRYPILVVFLVVMGIFPSLTFASESVMDDSTKAEINFSFSGKPVAGEKSEITIQFNNYPTGFTISDCGCVLEVWQNNQLATTIDILSTVTPIRLHYTFKQAGQYKLRFTGASKSNPQLFTPFAVEQSISVNSSLPQTANASSSFTNIVVFISSSILLGAGGYYLYYRSQHS
jgi:hypothetical protein